MKQLSVLLALLILLFLNACNVINPSEKIPTYIQIDSVQLLATNMAKHGSVNHKITDVWVYYNREILGPFELPARVPVLAEGHGELQILAGIYDNGLTATRTKYPFYAVDTFSFTAAPAQVIKHTPKFTYRGLDTTATVSYLIEDFEQGNIFTKRYNNDTTMIRTDAAADKFEGDWCGKIFFKDSVDNAECITSTSYLIPPFKEAYMELNYKCDVPFEIATEINYQGSLVNSSILNFKATDKWTKVYVSLNGFSNTFQNGSFKFVIIAAKPSTTAEATLLFDNFKIIYFN